MKITVFAVTMLAILLVAAPAFAYDVTTDFDWQGGATATQGVWTAGHVQGGTQFQAFTSHVSSSSGAGTVYGWNLGGDWDSQGNIVKCYNGDIYAWQSHRRQGWVGFGCPTSAAGWGGGVRFDPGPGTYNLDIFFVTANTYTSGDTMGAVVVQILDGTAPGALLGGGTVHNGYNPQAIPTSYEYIGQVTLAAGQSIYMGGGASIGAPYIEMATQIDKVPEPGSLMTLAGLLGTAVLGFRRRK